LKSRPSRSYMLELVSVQPLLFLICTSCTQGMSQHTHQMQTKSMRDWSGAQRFVAINVLQGQITYVDTTLYADKTASTCKVPNQTGFSGWRSLSSIPLRYILTHSLDSPNRVERTWVDILSTT